MEKVLEKFSAGLAFVQARRFLLAACLVALPAVSDEHDILLGVSMISGHATLLYVNPETLKVDHQAVFPCDAWARPVWSADGEAYAITFEDKIMWMQRGAETSHAIGEDGFRHRRNPALSPDGQLVAYEAYNAQPSDGAIVVHDMQSNTAKVWGGGRRMLLNPVWLPNPRLLLSIDPSREISIPGVDIDAVRRDTGLHDGSVLQGGPTRALFAIGFDSHQGRLTSEMLLVTETQTLPVLALVPDGPDSTRYSEWSPSISPGGQKVIFESDMGGDRELFQLDLNGLANITNHRAADWNPVWANNGRWIAFESFRDNRRSIFRMMVETMRVEKVADDAWAPTWSPDDDRIAFTRKQDGKAVIVVKDLGTGTETVVEGIQAWAPAWRPEP